MKPFPQAWQQGSQWFNRLSRRERALIMVTVLAFILLPGYVLFIEPKLIQQASLQMKTDRLVQSNNEKRQDIQSLKQQALANDQQSLSEQIRRLNAELEEINRADTEGTDRLLSTGQASQLLSSILTTAANLTLVSLEKVKASPVVMPHMDNDKNTHNGKQTKSAIVSLFRHSLALNLSGTTDDLMAFIDQIEQQKLPITIDRVIWRYGKGNHSELSLNLYSLGVSENWLGGDS